MGRCSCVVIWYCEIWARQTARMSCAGQPGLMPVDDAFERGLERPARMPAAGAGAPWRCRASGSWPRAGGRPAVELPAGAVAPGVAQVLDDPLHRAWHPRRAGRSSSLRRRPGPASYRRSASSQIAGQRLQHVLPGADGVRVADQHGLALLEARAGCRAPAGPRAQSPPPMTLPARAVATRDACAGVEERLAVGRLVTSSAQPLLLL